LTDFDSLKESPKLHFLLDFEYQGCFGKLKEEALRKEHILDIRVAFKFCRAVQSKILGLY